MELNVATFLWLRDVGSLPSTCAAVAKGGKMVKLQPDGLQRLTSGAPLVRALQHYCCDRFGVPKDLLLGVVADKTGSMPSQQSSSQAAVTPCPTADAARRHNWEVINRLVQEGLQVTEGLDAAAITAITERGDALEALLATKRIYDLLEGHRQLEKTEKLKHQRLTKDANKITTKHLLKAKPVAASLVKTANAGDGNTTDISSEPASTLQSQSSPSFSTPLIKKQSSHLGAPNTSIVTFSPQRRSESTVVQETDPTTPPTDEAVDARGKDSTEEMTIEDAAVEGDVDAVPEPARDVDDAATEPAGEDENEEAHEEDTATEVQGAVIS